MASLGSKKKVVLSKKDLKTAIVNKNEALKKANKNLQSDIKSLKAEKKQADKDLLTVRADCEDAFNEMDSAKTELSAINNHIESEKKSLDKIRSNKSKATYAIKKMEKTLLSNQEENDRLVSDIISLKNEKEEFSSLTSELKSIQMDIDSNKKELDKIKASKKRFKKQVDNCAKNCNEMLAKQKKIQDSLNDENAKYNAEMEVINKDLSISRSQCAKDKLALNESLAEKNIKLDETDSMIMKAEKEYIGLEKKIGIAKNNILEEESKIEDIKERFEAWKVSAVEEVARMKLRGRIENIDKAGLKDVLSR